MAKYYFGHSKRFMLVRPLLSGLTGSLLVLVLDAAFAVTPSFAAKTISFKYGIFQRSLPIADLRTYAETQEASSELKSALRYLSDENEQTVQSALQIKLPLNVVLVDRLLRTDTGQTALSEVAQVIEREDDAAIPALRAALILGANSSEGLGVLSFLEAYPSQTITIDLPKALEFVKENERLLRSLPEATQEIR